MLWNPTNTKYSSDKCLHQACTGINTCTFCQMGSVLDCEALRGKPAMTSPQGSAGAGPGQGVSHRKLGEADFAMLVTGYGSVMWRAASYILWLSGLVLDFLSWTGHLSSTSAVRLMRFPFENVWQWCFNLFKCAGIVFFTTSTSFLLRIAPLLSNIYGDLQFVFTASADWVSL